MQETKGSTSGLARVAGLIIAVIGAGSSLALMLYAARRQQSMILKLLFTGWTLAPFVAIAYAYMVWDRWPTTQRDDQQHDMKRRSRGSSGHLWRSRIGYA